MDTETYKNDVMTDHNEKKGTEAEQNKDAIVKPEPETLKTPDPQDKMEGPVSSLVQGIKHSSDNDSSKEEADREKDSKM